MDISESQQQRMRDLARMCMTQKKRVLDGEQGGFDVVLHRLFSEYLSEFTQKYGKQNGRDMVILLLYLHANKNGNSANYYYGWAFPSFEQIVQRTGIHRNRIAQLKEYLVKEGYLIIKRFPWNGTLKDMYLPLYYPVKNDEKKLDDGASVNSGGIEEKDDPQAEILKWL